MLFFTAGVHSFGLCWRNHVLLLLCLEDSLKEEEMIHKLRAIFFSSAVDSHQTSTLTMEMGQYLMCSDGWLHSLDCHPYHCFTKNLVDCEINQNSSTVPSN